MAIYRNVEMSFWKDPDVKDNFTPEDKYFFLYLLTNPYTNLCGCYEISTAAISEDTGYNKDTVIYLINRFVNVHRIIKYSSETKEIYIVNWRKHNWTKSFKLDKPLFEEIQAIKNNEFRDELMKLYCARDTVSIPYPYTSDTTVSVTVTDNNNNTNTSNTKDMSIDDSKQILDRNWFDVTFEKYPNKNFPDAAYRAWVNMFYRVVPENLKDVANEIYGAVVLYLRDYKKTKPDDPEMRYVPNFEKWLKDSSNYWMQQLNKIRKAKEDANNAN